MRAVLSRLVDLREGELAPVVGAFVTLFGLIASHTMLETARDALFLGKLPPQLLTLVYVLLAGLSLVATALTDRFVRRFGRRNALVFTLLVAAYGTTLLYFLPKNPVVVFALYLWSGLLGTVLVVEFWLFAGQLFTVAQGKRLFGPMAAGGVLGAVIGASLAAALLEVINVGALLLVSAGIFLATGFFLTTVAGEESRVAQDVGRARPKAAGALATLRESPYLQRLALLVALSTAALLTTDYLFKTTAARSMPASELGGFFARYYACLNAAALVVQLLLAGPLVRRLGVVAAAAVLPAMLLAGAGGVVLAGSSRLLVMLTKGADGALRHSLHRVTSELLGMPLEAGLRARSKALLETFMSRGVQAVTASGLLVLTTLVPEPRVLAALVIILSGAWFVVALGMRRPYLDLFRRALSRGSLETTLADDDLDMSSVEAVMEALSSRDATRVIAAIDLLDEKKRERLIPGLILYHEAEEVLLRALTIVSLSSRDDWLPLAERLLDHPSEPVRVAAVRALAVRSPDAVEKARNDPSPAVRAHAAFCRVECHTLPPLEDATLRDLLALDGEPGRAARAALLDSIRDQAAVRWTDVVLQIAEREEREVVEPLARAMAKIPDPRFVPLLVPRLRTRDGRSAVREAIVAHGDIGLDALERAMEDPMTDTRVRLHIPRTIGRFGTQRAADLLFAYLTKEPSGLVRYKVLRALGRLIAEHRVQIDRAKVLEQTQKNLVELLRVGALKVPLEGGLEDHPEHARASGSLVVGLLEDKMRQSLERAFRLLQIAHKNEDIMSVMSAVGSKDKRVRANAMEFLDVLTVGRAEGESIRALFRIVVDDLSLPERVSRAREFIPAGPTGYLDAMRRLLKERDASLAALAAYHALELGVGELEAEVEATVRARPSLVVPGLDMPALSLRAAARTKELPA